MRNIEVFFLVYSKFNMRLLPVHSAHGVHTHRPCVLVDQDFNRQPNYKSRVCVFRRVLKGEQQKKCASSIFLDLLRLHNL